MDHITFVYSTIRHDFYSSDAEYDMYTDSRYSDHYDEQAQGYFARLWAALLGREAPVTHR
jgi:hypothetical protein